jgi:hypothetical protein
MLLGSSPGKSSGRASSPLEKSFPWRGPPDVAPLRFSRLPNHPDTPAALASLALWRALAHFLVETKRLTQAEIDLIRADAMGEFAGAEDDPVVKEAMALIASEFP